MPKPETVTFILMWIEKISLKVNMTNKKYILINCTRRTSIYVRAYLPIFKQNYCSKLNYMKNLGCLLMKFKNILITYKYNNNI